jgi:hypothetical protein
MPDISECDRYFGHPRVCIASNITCDHGGGNRASEGLANSQAERVTVSALSNVYRELHMILFT